MLRIFLKKKKGGGWGQRWQNGMFAMCQLKHDLVTEWKHFTFITKNTENIKPVSETQQLQAGQEDVEW